MGGKLTSSGIAALDNKRLELLAQIADRRIMRTERQGEIMDEQCGIMRVYVVVARYSNDH